MNHPKHFPIPSYNASIRKNAAACMHGADAAYEAQLRAIAQDIHDHRETKSLILLSGPSGSGKTTTAYLLKHILEEQGFVTHTLSMDNYFLPLPESEQKLVMQGKIDLESPNRLNRGLLNEQLSDMIACKPVPLPRYDFVHGLSVGSGITLTRKPHELVIVEGIHALNPSVITIPDDQTTRIYVSVRTRVQAGDITLHPSKIRLLRRMVRDQLYRDRPFSKTIQLYSSVERGEERYIMPYKYRSTYDIDTFIEYELNVLTCMLPQIEQLPAEVKAEISDLIAILKAAEPVDASLVPKGSLLREFIGGGKFSY